MIRKFVEQDIDKIMTIWLEANLSAHNFVNQNYWLTNYDLVKSLLPKSTVYVYKKNDDVLGFIGLNNNIIEGLFVTNKFTGNSIGKELLNFAKDKFDNLFLSVYKENVRAVNFYLREGFLIFDEKIDVDTGKKEYIMKWKKDNV